MASGLMQKEKFTRILNALDDSTGNNNKSNEFIQLLNDLVDNADNDVAMDHICYQLVSNYDDYTANVIEAAREYLDAKGIDITNFNKLIISKIEEHERYQRAGVLSVCHEYQKHREATPGVAKARTNTHMNELWNTVNCDGDATLFLMHGVSYISKDIPLFQVPENMVYIQMSRIGMDLLADGDPIIIRFIENRTKYLTMLFATGSTGDPEIDYLLAECIIYFPGQNVPLRYLFGKPPDGSGPPINTYYYKKDSTVEDVTKFRYVISQLNGMSPNIGSGSSLTGKAYITNADLLNAIKERATPGSALSDSDYVEHKYHLVFVGACSSKRSHHKQIPFPIPIIVNSEGDIEAVCKAIYKKIYNHEEAQCKWLLQLFSDVFSTQYAAILGDPATNKAKYKSVDGYNIPNIDIPPTKSNPTSWALIGYGIFYDIHYFLSSDKVGVGPDEMLGTVTTHAGPVTNLPVDFIDPKAGHPGLYSIPGAGAGAGAGSAPTRMHSLANRSVDPSKATVSAKAIVKEARELIHAFPSLSLTLPDGTKKTIFIQRLVLGDGAASGGGSSSAPTYGGALRKRKCTHYKHKRTARKRTRRAPRKHGR